MLKYSVPTRVEMADGGLGRCCRVRPGRASLNRRSTCWLEQIFTRAGTLVISSARGRSELIPRTQLDRPKQRRSLTAPTYRYSVTRFIGMVRQLVGMMI